MNSTNRFINDNPLVLFAVVVIIWGTLFLLRFAAPSDLLDKDQERPAAYMADAALNGNWIVQVDDHGKVCSKPPVYTWIGAGLILLTGRINDFALYFPSALGVFGCCALMWLIGARRFGYSAAFLGASFLLLSAIGIRILYLARTDALFSFATFLTACLGYQAWMWKRSWLWFWLAATLTTLTKGPLGLVLAAGGLIGVIREDRSGTDRSRLGWPPLWLCHAIGIFFLLAVSLGWLWLAYQQKGDAVIAKLLGRELIGHANWSSERFSPGYFFFIVPGLYFISRFFPWSLPALKGLWRVWKHPADHRDERSLERFLASYFVFGIILFSMFPHQRPDHLFPLMPAAGLLAGREAARWLGRRGRAASMLPYTVMLWLLVLSGFGIYYYKIDPANNAWFEKTAGVRQLARQYEHTYGTGRELIFVDVPYGLQYYLNAMQQRASYADAARILETSEDVLLAVHDIEQFKRHLKPGVPLHVLMQWPENGTGFVHVVSNRRILP